MEITTIIAQAKRAAEAHYDAYYGYQQTAAQRNTAQAAIHRINKIAETLTDEEREMVEAIMEAGRQREAEAEAAKQEAIAKWRAARAAK